jgi:hypothetical protein
MMLTKSMRNKSPLDGLGVLGGMVEAPDKKSLPQHIITLVQKRESPKSIPNQITRFFPKQLQNLVKTNTSKRRIIYDNHTFIEISRVTTY